MYLDLIMKLKKINNREHIFDVVRKKYVKNTPEEWVRQNTINFLIQKRAIQFLSCQLKELVLLMGCKKDLTLFVLIKTLKPFC